jgi:hypothetical protein
MARIDVVLIYMKLVATPLLSASYRGSHFLYRLLEMLKRRLI